MHGSLLQSLKASKHFKHLPSRPSIVRDSGEVGIILEAPGKGYFANHVQTLREDRAFEVEECVNVVDIKNITPIQDGENLRVYQPRRP